MPSQTKIFFLSIVYILLLSCRKEQKASPKPPNENIEIAEKDTTRPKEVANLEEIPFDLPKDWIYQKMTDEIKKTWENPDLGFVAIAGNPTDQKFSVTVWKYGVITLEELLPLFKRDMEALGRTVELETRNGIVYGLTEQGTAPRFRWKGKTVKKKDSLIFVAVGSLEEIYDEHIAYIDSLFNTIHVD